MKQQAAGAIGAEVGRSTCTACPLLCDDVLITTDGVAGACLHGSETIRAAIAGVLHPRSATGPSPEAWENDSPLARETAIERAAKRLASARRVLVTGLASATLEAITAACDLAESLGAAVDAGLPESSRAAGPTIARAGEVTAVWEELRDRADLVLFWGCDPAASHPRFIERFIASSLSDGRHRRTIAVGPHSVLPDATTHHHLPLPHGLAVEAARGLQMLTIGRPDVLSGTPVAAVCTTLHDAIQAANCVAIVTSDGDDPIGLEAWSIVHLVRTIAHIKPAFQIPLGAGLAAGGANVAGAAAVCTWRYGAAGGIATADPAGSLFLPAESDARRLVDRGEVDVVLVLGRLADPLEQSIADRGARLSVVRICDAPEPLLQRAGDSFQLRCACMSLCTTGTMLREDGRRVVLTPSMPAGGFGQPAGMHSMRDTLIALTNAVRQTIASPASQAKPASQFTGGRP